MGLFWSAQKKGGAACTAPLISASGALPTGRIGSVAVCAQLQPLVPPQVSHLRQVPLRNRVKLPHSPQLSPSYPFMRAVRICPIRLSAVPSALPARLALVEIGPP